MSRSRPDPDGLSPGKYNYVEKGHKGYLKISQQGRFFKVRVETNDKSSGQMCSFVATEAGTRTDDDFPAVAASDGGAKFSLKFSKDGGKLTVDVTDKGGECGMSGWFGGKYVKAVKK